MNIFCPLSFNPLLARGLLKRGGRKMVYGGLIFPQKGYLIIYTFIFFFFITAKDKNRLKKPLSRKSTR